MSHPIREMWQHYNSYKQLTSCSDSTLHNCFQAWKHRHLFMQLHKKVQQRGRQRRRERFGDVLRRAEEGHECGNRAVIYQAIRRLAPKSTKKSWQMRKQGQVLTPSQEVKFVREVWQGIFGRGRAPMACISELNITEEEVSHAILRMGNLKALPHHSAPTILWKHCADALADKVYDTVLKAWTQQVHIPAEWSAAWIHFLPKKLTNPRAPDALRPIGLLDPMGKVVLMVLKQRVHPCVTKARNSAPQYAYLPYRSTHQVLLKVFSHCEEGRRLAKAQQPNLIEPFGGAKVRECAGAFQISLDFSKAFDSLDRNYIYSSMMLCGVPEPEACAIVSWHSDVKYHIQSSNGEEKACIDTKCGIRQGCPIAPTIWIAFMRLVLTEFSRRYGDSWLQEHISLFADDTHMGWTFTTEQELFRALSQAGEVLVLLEPMGLTINASKSAFLCVIGGRASKKIRASILQHSAGKTYINIGKGSHTWKFPVVHNHKYLGT